MLESKYLTKDGVELFLSIIYKQGFNYLFLDTNADMYVASNEKPEFVENVFMFCGGRQSMICGGFATTILKDLLENRNYIEIDDYIDYTDWSKVEVDTPVYVRNNDEEDWEKRHFAYFKNGKVYTWSSGTTSWTAVNKDYVFQWEHAKLA